MIELAKSFGLSAKFTGSGGAIVCIRNSKFPVIGLESSINHDSSLLITSGCSFTMEELIEEQSKFRLKGYQFEKIEISSTSLL